MGVARQVDQAANDEIDLAVRERALQLQFIGDLGILLCPRLESVDRR